VFPLGRRRGRRITLKWIFKDIGWEHELDSSGSGQGQVAGSCKHGNDTLTSIKYQNFLTRYGPASFSRRALLHGVGPNGSRHSLS